MAFLQTSFSWPCVPRAGGPLPAGRGTYPRGHGLQRGDVVLQGQAAAVVEHGFHSGHVRLHQLLPLVGGFLLQRLHLLLEVLPSKHMHMSIGN